MRCSAYQSANGNREAFCIVDANANANAATLIWNFTARRSDATKSFRFKVGSINSNKREDQIIRPNEISCRSRGCKRRIRVYFRLFLVYIGIRWGTYSCGVRRRASCFADTPKCRYPYNFTYPHCYYPKLCHLHLCIANLGIFSLSNASLCANLKLRSTAGPAEDLRGRRRVAHTVLRARTVQRGRLSGHHVRRYWRSVLRVTDFVIFNHFDTFI